MRNCFKPLVVFILLSIFSVSSIEASKLQAEEKNIALDFKLQDLNRDTFTLSSYKDKQPVILFFWTTWCPFCRKELQALKESYPQLAEEGWELFAVNVGESSSEVDKAVKGYALNFKVLLDKDTAVADSYGILGVPTYFFIDKKGYIVFNDHYFPKGKYKELISK